jgi:hypothetical protein
VRNSWNFVGGRIILMNAMSVHVNEWMSVLMVWFSGSWVFVNFLARGFLRRTHPVHVDPFTRLFLAFTHCVTYSWSGVFGSVDSHWCWRLHKLNMETRRKSQITKQKTSSHSFEAYQDPLRRTGILENSVNVKIMLISVTLIFLSFF